MSEWLPLLAEASIQATLVLAAAWGVSLTMRRASATTRHLLWACALAGAVLVPLSAGAFPRWAIDVPLPTLEVTSPPVPTTLEMPPTQRASIPRMTTDVGVQTPASVLASDSRPSTRDTSRVTAVPSSAWAVVVVWVAGVVLVLLRLGAGSLAAARLRRTAREPDAAWVDEARSLAAAIGVSRPIRFVESDAIGTPMVLGVWRPMVAMPTAAADWSETRWRLVLLHELAHVRRRDCLTQFLASLACAVHWWNPLVWLTARRLRIERERACDDFVLTAGAAGPDYADHLLDIARATTRRSLLLGAGVAMARRSQLEGRLMAILDPGIRRSSAVAGRLAAVALVAAVSIPVAAIQLRPTGPSMAEVPPAMIESGVARRGPVPMAQADQASQSATQSAEASADAQAEQNGVEVAPAPAEADDRVLDALITALDDADSGVRETVARTLARTRDPRAIAALVPLVQDPDPDIREIAVSMIARNPGADAVPVLTAALQDEEPDVREIAAHALGEMRDPSTIGALTAALDDADADVREAAAVALGRLRDARALAPLTGALDDTEPDVREAAVFGLSQLRDPGALEPLLLALQDEEPNVREQAAFALGQLRDPRAIGPLSDLVGDIEADVREQVVFALSQLRDPRSLDPLLRALDDEMADVREQAAFALGELRDPRALDALLDALTDEMADVREQAARAIGQLNGR